MQVEKTNEYIDNRKEKNFKIREKCFVYIFQLANRVIPSNKQFHEKIFPELFDHTLYTSSGARA